MKSKKAVKRLTKVEALLSNIIDRYAGNPHRVEELLDSAKKAVVRAKETVNHQASSKVTKGTPVKAAKSPRRRLAADDR